jgi:hypothetical protein
VDGDDDRRAAASAGVHTPMHTLQRTHSPPGRLATQGVGALRSHPPDHCLPCVQPVCKEAKLELVKSTYSSLPEPVAARARIPFPEREGGLTRPLRCACDRAQPGGAVKKKKKLLAQWPRRVWSGLHHG